MFSKDEIDRVLLRFLQGELDGEGREQVMQWLHEDEKHEVYFQEFCKMHVYLQWTTREDTVKGTYQNFRKKLARKHIVMWWAKVAAGVLLLVGTGIGLRYWISPGDVKLIETGMESIIPAGKVQATLYLSSGVAVAIDSSYKTLRENDGTSIEVSTNGAIRYRDTFSGEEGNESLINRLVVPRRGEFNLTLADGTKVWLNSESELSYPLKFSGTERVVYLEGEAYFDVAPDKESPFIVKVNDLEVKVYGTQFNINARREGIVETVLVKGSVGLTGRGCETMLEPEQKAEYDSRSGKVVVEEVDVLPYVAWQQGNFVFQNESLESIMEKLKLWYDLEVIYQQKDVRDIRLSGIMERYKEVNELLHFFEKSSDLKFTIKGNIVSVGRRN